MRVHYAQGLAMERYSIYAGRHRVQILTLRMARLSNDRQSRQGGTAALHCVEIDIDTV